MKELDKKLVAAKELGAEEKNEISNLNENVEGNDSNIHFLLFRNTYLMKLRDFTTYYELSEWC